MESIFELFKDQPAEVEPRVVAVDLIDVDDAIPPTDEFVQSVESVGIIHPPRLCKGNEEGRYKIVDGRRRVLAARKLGLTEILVIYSPLSYADAQRSVLTIEAQSKWADNPVAEYEAVKKLIDDGFRLEQIKQSLGLSAERINRVLSLGSLPPSILGAVKKSEVSMSTASSLAKLPERYREEAVKIFEEKGKLTGKDVQSVRQAKQVKSGQALMAAIQEAQADEVNDLGLKIRSLLKPEKEKGAATWNAAIQAVLGLLEV
jgi:ParB/RepB/Spo0J family partition protein